MLTSEEFDRAVQRYRRYNTDSISRIIENASDPIAYVNNPRNGNYDSAFKVAVAQEVQERQAQRKASQQASKQQEDPFLKGFNSVRPHQWNW